MRGPAIVEGDSGTLPCGRLSHARNRGAVGEGEATEISSHSAPLCFCCGRAAYLMAEAMGLSGIVSLFFFGIVLSHYNWSVPPRYLSVLTPVFGTHALRSLPGTLRAPPRG